MLRKADELQDCVGVSCEGFEEQFGDFLVAIEADQPLPWLNPLQRKRGNCKDYRLLLIERILAGWKKRYFPKGEIQL